MRLAIVLVAAFVLLPAFAQDHSAHSTAPPPVALEEGLSDLHFKVNTNDTEAQRYFDQGMRYVYAFNHEHAVASFRRATEIERSLRNMRTDVLDLHYFHHCDFGPGDRYLDGALEVMHRLRDEGKVRFIGLSDWNLPRIMDVIERIDPDVVQPYRNLVDDDYEASGLKPYIDAHDLGVAFFSPLKHGLLLGKYTEPVDHGKGDFRSGVGDFQDAEAIALYQRAAAAMREKYADRPEPVLHAVVGALLPGNPTACILLGQRNVKQVQAAAAIGDALTAEEAAWVRTQYRG